MTAEELWTAIIAKIEGKDGAMQKWHDSGVETTWSGFLGKKVSLPVADRIQKCFTKNLAAIKEQTIPLLSFYNDKPGAATWLINQSQHVINIGYIVKTIMPDWKAVQGQQVINITSTQIADIARVLAFGYSYAEKRFEDLNPQYLQQIKTELTKWNTNRATFNKDNKPIGDYDKYQIDNYISKVMNLDGISAPVPEVLQTHINIILTQAAISLSAKSLVYTTPASSSIFLCDGLPAWLTEPAPANLSSSSSSSSGESKESYPQPSSSSSSSSSSSGESKESYPQPSSSSSSSSSLSVESKENYPQSSSSSSSSSEESKTAGGFYSEIDILEEQYAIKVRDCNTIQAELKRIQKEHKQLLKRGSTLSAPGYKKEVINAVQEYKDLLETIQTEKLAIAKRLSKLKLEQVSESATIMKGTRRHTRGSKHHRTRKYVRT